MKKYLSLIIIVLISSVNIFSQTDAIKKIKEQYYQVTDENYQTHQLTFNTMLPAIGLQTTNVKYYYSSIQSNPEIDPYKLTYKVVKILVTYNVAANMDFTFEYLFDDNQNLIFLYENSYNYQENIEKRYYYNKTNLIQINSKTFDNKGLKDDYSESKNFKPNDLQEAKKNMIKAKKHVSLFSQIINIENLDKN
ncbi:MAG: hypothetical protein JXR51_03985 [Bacteroidales bacterium]|nr:hypothetical protein [Bacteroidales bacterium]MBN2756315.1 hypothetical protein [Bacteroidales bacterium]